MQLPRMMEAICLLFHVICFSGVSLAAAQSRPLPGQVTLDSLWEARRHKDDRAAGVEKPPARAHRKGNAEHVTLAAGGSLLRSEKDASLVEGSDPLQNGEPSLVGAVARQFILRDGLKPVERTPSFSAPAAALSDRLHEIHGRCDWILSKGWALLDAAVDTEGGHHWVLKGPSADGSKQLLLHVKSESEKVGHAPLSFSPMSLCPKVPAALLDSNRKLEWPEYPRGVADPNAVAHDVDVGEPEQLTLSNDNAQKSIVIIRAKIISETKKCSEFELVANATALSATAEVADALNVMVTMRLTPVKKDPSANCDGTSEGCVQPPDGTYHVFSVDWKCVNNCPNGLTPEFGPMPFDKKEQDEVGWCDLMEKSTEENLGNLVQTHGRDAPEIFLSKLGFNNVYRDYRDADEKLFEKQDSGTRLSADCIAVDRLPDTYDIRARNPICMNKENVEDQGPCASCWAFATASSLAARACIKYPRAMIGPGYKRKMFSKQQMMSCNTDQKGCTGGGATPAFEEAKKGIAMEDDYGYYPGHAHEFPWSGLGQRCKWGLVPKPWVVTAHYPVNALGGVGAIQQEIFCKGPVTVGFAIYANFFSFWATDKYRVMTKADIVMAGSAIGGHAVTVLGWGHMEPTDPNAGYGTGTKFWECMNSWGPDWGNDGFFRMERGVNLCNMETMSVHAGDIEPTEGSWMYQAWGTCDAASDRKTRPIKCMSNNGETQQTSDTCPVLSFNSNPYDFPNPTSVHYQEIEAIKSCSNSPTSCNMFSACYGNGEAALIAGNCNCTCFANYEGDNCESCTQAASGWPRCREMCASADCSDHGIPSGNKWKTEFGDKRDSCECECSPGFAGDTCDACANPITHVFPNCVGSISPYKSTTDTTSKPFPTTTLPPCRVSRGAIELMPPTGKNWLVLNCDTRKRDCEPDLIKCTNETIYQQYCQVQNTTEFPDGQCMPQNSTNATDYHVKIAGTDRDGENLIPGQVARDNFTITSSRRRAPPGAAAANASDAATIPGAANDPTGGTAAEFPVVPA